jgi:hypothetical protein
MRCGKRFSPIVLLFRNARHLARVGPTAQKFYYPHLLATNDFALPRPWLITE